jgi:hypothetical protein
MEFYPDANEKIPKDLPPEKGPRVRMNVCIDSDHAHDLVTRRFITGYSSVRRQWRHQLMAQNWWHRGLIQNSFLKLGIYFGPWEWH